MPPPILEACSLTKRYSGLPAVREASLAIRPGEVLGLLGPNGSGKSTIVKMLVGLLDPTAGQVLFQGANIRHDRVRYKSCLGYVPEQPDLYSFLTGWEYLELVAALRELPARPFEAKAAALLQSLTLYPHRHSLIGSYSKGMRQRIVLISALLHDPDVLILDEPLSGLDVASALVVRRLIELLANAGKAVLFSSPVLEVMEKVCTHIVILKQGNLVASGSMEEVRSSQAAQDLEAAFVQVTEQVDTDAIAQSMLEAVRA